jgi:plastocyanin domain-containing protein
MHVARPVNPWWRRLLDALRPAAADAGPQIRVVRWGGDSEPSHVVVKAHRPIRLVFERLDATSAADFLTIPALGWVTTLGWMPRSSVDIGPCPVGSYAFSSLDGALHGCLVVEP